MIDRERFRWFEITPVDAWFFRDGRPSNRGEDQDDLHSEFPPSTATVIGGIRAALARSNGWNGQGPWDERCAAVLGDGPTDLGALSLLGVFLRERDSLLWPMPRHVVGHFEPGPDMNHRQFHPVGRLVPSEHPVACDMGNVHLPTLGGNEESSPDRPNTSRPPEPPDGVYLTTEGMNQVLRGEIPSADGCRTLDQLIRTEPRIGIARDEGSRTTGDNALYHPRYVRLRRGLSIAVALSGIPDQWRIPTVMPLGGESRMAGILPIAPPALPALSGRPDRPVAADRHLVISLTPSYFTRPWWGAGPGDPASGLRPDLDGHVVTAVIDRPTRIGGWDFRRGGPLPIVPYVPPGTAWWIDRPAVTPHTLIRIGEHPNHGLGLACVARVT